MFIKTDITEAITNTAAIATSEALNESDLPATIRVILSLGAGVIIGVKGSKYIIKSGKTGEILGEIAGGASIKEGIYGIIENAINTSNIDEIETIIRSFDLKDLSSEEIENLIKAANKSNLSSDDIKKIEKLLRNEGISKVIESGSIKGFKYKHNSSNNPKVLQDAIENPNAVYGYSPNPNSESIGGYADAIDWSNPTEVAKARARRQAYHEKNDNISELVIKMKVDGYSVEGIAKAANHQRNLNRLNDYIDDIEGLARVKERNRVKYGNENGPTAEYLF